MIAILAPYGRNEVTLAAIRVADLAVAEGHEVRFVACGVHEANVHPYWDTQISSSRGEGIYRTVHGAKTVVYFEANRHWLDQASLVTRRKDSDAKHILVPNWHTLTPDSADVLYEFPLIVAPSKYCCHLLRDSLYPNRQAEAKAAITHVTWDAGLPLVQHPTVKRRLRLCLYCDNSVVDWCDASIANLMQQLLTMFPRLELTMLTTKSWNSRFRAYQHQLRVDYSPRLRFAAVTGYMSLLREFNATDWVGILSVQADFGIVASIALACGAPVIANGLEPYTEIIKPSRGFLVPCSTYLSPFGAPVGIFDSRAWLDTCRLALSDRQPLEALKANDWQQTDARKTFTSVWAKAWN